MFSGAIAQKGERKLVKIWNQKCKHIFRAELGFNYEGQGKFWQEYKNIKSLREFERQGRADWANLESVQIYLSMRTLG